MSKLESAILHTLLINLSVAGYYAAALYDGRHYLMPESIDSRELRAYVSDAGSVGYPEEQVAPATIKRPLREQEILQVLEAQSSIQLCFTRRHVITWRQGGNEVILEAGEQNKYLTITWYDGDHPFETIVEEVGKAVETLGG